MRQRQRKGGGQMRVEYRTIHQFAGPLVFVEKTHPVGYGELVQITLSDGSPKRGQVLDTSDEMVVVQVFEGTSGIDRDSKVTFMGETFRMPVSRKMLGRILSGSGQPLDGGPDIVFESYDAGAPHTDHLICIRGASSGAGEVIWGTRPEGGVSSGGGYGDNCMRIAPDITGDGVQDVLLGTAWPSSAT